MSHHSMFNLIVGTTMLFIMVIIPIWASIRLLYDDIYIYFMGRNLPLITLVSCFAVVFGYVVVMNALIKFGKSEEARTQETFLATFMVFITLLGLCLLLVSMPMQAKCDRVFRDLTMNCDTGKSTAPLYKYYDALLTIRTKPDCITKMSVEQCDGYQASMPYTGFLKYLEGDLMCSGFGYTPPNGSAAAFGASSNSTGSNDTDSASLFQQQAHITQAHVTHRNKLAGMLHNLASEAGAIGAADAASGAVKYEPPTNSAFPPTLFNSANYQASCDGMAARVIRFKALDIADNQYLQGVLMLIGAVVAGILRAWEMCTKVEKKQLGFQGYTVDNNEINDAVREVVL